MGGLSSWFRVFRLKEGEEISSFTCEICMEAKAARNQRFKNKGCSHPLCCDCISKYIESKVVHGDTGANVVCPHLDCNRLLDPLSCRAIIPGETFNRWCDRLCEWVISEIKSKAYCPFQKCSALVLNECGEVDVTKAMCPDCRNLFCFKCMVPWHAGYRCDETGVKRDGNDLLFGMLIETKRWQKCPACNTCVELISGCACITCRGDKNGSFTCEICMEPMGRSQRFRTITCSHPLCLDCISMYIDSKLRDNVSNVGCPYLGCSKFLDPPSCQTIIPALTFERWCDLLCESAIDGVQKAYCPYKDCSALVLNECGGPLEKATCPNCMRPLRKVSWWRRADFWLGKTEVYRRKDQNDVLFGQLVKRKGWQKCPKCKRCVERVSGCEVMTCRCGTSFCYFCGSKFSFSHLFRCKGKN